MLELKNVDSYYGESRVIEKLSFDVPDGKIVGLIGRNGVGKSTALKSIMGIVKTPSGEILFNGERLMKIFCSDGDDKLQNSKWAQHILDTYNQSIVAHSAECLASDKTFLCDFTDNADEHRKLVCRYCGEITSLKYFNT